MTGKKIDPGPKPATIQRMAIKDNSSVNLIDRMEHAYEHWIKRHAPDWLWKLLLHHPDSFMRSNNPAKEIVVTRVLIVIASIALVVFLILRFQ